MRRSQRRPTGTRLAKQKKINNNKKGGAPDPVSAVPVTGSPGTNHFLLHANHDTMLWMNPGTGSEDSLCLSLYDN